MSLLILPGTFNEDHIIEESLKGKVRSEWKRYEGGGSIGITKA